MTLSRTRWTLGCLLLLASTVTFAATTLKIATIVPEGSNWMTSMRAGAQEIEQRTEGRVEFKFYAGGVQGNDAQVMRKMRIGQLQGGAFTSGALGNFTREADIYSLPMQFADFDEVRYVRERMDPKIYQSLDQAGYVTFGFAGGGFAYLMSRSPIGQQADMKGMKIWIPEGDAVARMASEALGIAPVTLSLTDVLTGLQTELIDTVMGPPMGVIVMQWHTAIGYITHLPVAYVYAGIVIDKKAFSRIAQEDQAIVREVMAAIYRQFDQDGMTDDEKGLVALQNEGLQLVEVSAAEQQGWKNVLDQAIEASAKRGELPGELLAELQCHLAAYRSGDTQAACDG